MKKKTIVFALLFPIFLLGCTTQGGGISNDSSSNQDTSVVTSDTSSSPASSETSVSHSSTAISSSSEASSSHSSSAASSSVAPSVPNYVVHGLFQNEEDWTDKQMQANPSSDSEYMIQGVQLHESDLFKIHMYGDIWYGYSALKSSVPFGLVKKGASDDNIEVRQTGTYDIYCSYIESDGGHIYLNRTDVTPPPSTVGVTGISLDRTGKFMELRHEFILNATVYPENATNKQVTWRSSDTSIATVSKAGRVTAVGKGSATITAKTEDGGKTATCLVYVSVSPIPDYYLTGTINGRSYAYGSYIYAAIPLSTGKYLIPDVELASGDSITVTAKHGAKLKDKYNQTYTVEIRNKRSVNAYLDVNDANYNYLTFVDK